MGKICCTCKKNLSNDMFWKRGGDRGDKPQAECKDCVRTRRKEYRLLTKRKIIELLGNRCALCGHTSETGVSLSIDHRDPDYKSNSAANITQWRWERIIKEIELGNCWLLCMNCHMEEEEKRRVLKTRAA